MFIVELPANEYGNILGPRVVMEAEYRSSGEMTLPYFEVLGPSAYIEQWGTRWYGRDRWAEVAGPARFLSKEEYVELLLTVPALSEWQRRAVRALIEPPAEAVKQPFDKGVSGVLSLSLSGLLIGRRLIPSGTWIEIYVEEPKTGTACWVGARAYDGEDGGMSYYAQVLPEERERVPSLPEFLPLRNKMAVRVAGEDLL